MQARIDAGLTQVQVADKLGKPQSFVSKYERGERRIDFTEFLEIADALGLELGNFLKAYEEKVEVIPRVPKPRRKKTQS